MLELKRIYWTRQLLRLAMAALTVWIFAGAILSLVTRSGNATAVRPPKTVTAILPGCSTACWRPSRFLAYSPSS